ncbi:non-ribosomal peptide synthetase [Frondihabitans cladoniiphilus]
MSLLRRWRSVVASVPDGIAAVSGSTSYSYAEADRISDLMALELVAALGESEEPIGALLGQDTAAVLAFLTVLKSGRMIVVLDAHTPAERLEQIVDLAGVSTCLVDGAVAEVMATIGGVFTTTFSLDHLIADAAASTVSAEALADRVALELFLGASRTGADGVQIVFTSGSTGVPKGVVQTHATFLASSAAVLDWPAPVMGPGDKTGLVLPLSFVAGSLILFNTLLMGATAVLADPRDIGADGLLQLVREHRIDLLDATPHLVRGMTAALDEGEVLDSIRLLVTMGEGVHSNDVEGIRKHLVPSAVFGNAFGSSEMNSVAFFHVSLDGHIPRGMIPAGRPVLGKEVVVLREDGTEAAVGETGDILVYSDYLAPGYWRNDELTAEKFGVDAGGRRFARLGDLGHFGEDGHLRIGGRSDSGVKVRGYLVEPSEIESALLSLDEIGEAVVIPIVTDNAPTRLVAYVSPKSTLRPPSGAAIRRSLRSRLPEYMVPGDIVQLNALPRTERGKVDRTSLPPVPPRQTNVMEMDQRELALSTIWQQVLELPELHLDDDFMALGGDSLSAEEMLVLVKDVFGVEIPSMDVLKFPTLREFAQRIGSDESTLPSHPDVMTLNAEGSATPLFCFPGAGSLALTYFPLSKQFPDTPLYAFQQHGIEKRALPDRSLEAMAQRYVQLMRIVRPHGPYRLVGHSFGGLVAMEVARMLTEAGEVVEQVVILDTYGPRSITEFDEANRPSTEPVPALADGSPIATAKNVVGRVKSRYVPDGIPRGENIGRQFRAYLAGILRHEGQRQYDSFFDHAVLLGRRYQVKPYFGDVVLVLAEENPDGFEGWKAALKGRVTVVGMKAEHTSILREPHVAQLAEHLRDAFDAIPAG